MSKPYRPSNGTEGEGFYAAWCAKCQHERYMRTNPERARGCQILVRTMAYDVDDPKYPPEWIVGPDGPECTAFTPETPRKAPVRKPCPLTVDMFQQEDA